MPVRARFLRIRNQDGAYGDLSTIRQIRVYAEDREAKAGPEAERGRADFPWLTLDEISFAKLLLAYGGAALACIGLLLSRRDSETGAARWLRGAIVATAICAGLGWWNFFQFTDADYDLDHRHYHDVYHYYLGAKYHPELRYTNLYRCQLAADDEDGFRRAHLMRRLTRDLSTNDLVPTSRVLAETGLCTAEFSPERWAEFKHDNSWFRRHMSPADWQTISTDHGYNGSPAFAALARTISSLGPISSVQFALLVSIDTVFIVFLWYAAWATFGWRSTSAALLFWGTNLVAAPEFITGSFMRLDAFFLVVMGVCCLKLRKMGLAGFLLGYATLLRVFPIFLLIGVAIDVLWDLYTRRSLRVRAAHRKLILGVLSAILLLFFLGSVAGGGASAWVGFAENTLKHRETALLQTMGMGALIAHIDRSDLRVRPRATVKEVEASYASPKRRLIRVCLAVLVVPLLLMAIYREETWVAAILGVAWLPFVTDLTNYYWWLLVVFGFLTLRRPSLIVSFSCLTIAFATIGFAYPGYSLALYTWSSLAMMLFLLAVLTSMAWGKLWGQGAGSLT